MKPPGSMQKNRCPGGISAGTLASKLKGMNTKKFCYLLLFALGALHPQVDAQKPVALETNLKKTIQWPSPSLNREIPLNIYYQGTPAKWEEPEVTVYLKNKAWERIGQESDQSILSDYIGKKFIVITADYGN